MLTERKPTDESLRAEADDERGTGMEFTERDVVILRELAGDPQVSSRQLTEILDEKYDIDVSHVTVSEVDPAHARGGRLPRGDHPK